MGLHHGCMGHEMLNEFNLINMNGRVYDSVLGRFLSPDKYVQEGDNSQNYNSYSYCLNNPLKYADPSGNVFVLDDFIAITAMGAMMGAMNAAMSDKPIWKGALLGTASTAATYGIGQLFGVAGSFGHELLRAGAHGLSSGVFNALNGDNFWNGLISGAASSGIGSYAQSVNLNTGLMVASTTTMGGIVAWATGDDFLQGAMQGMQIGILNHSLHDGDEGSIPLKVSVTTNEAGMYEVTVIGARKGGKENILAIAAEINTITDCFGTSLKKNSGNTTLGSNGKLYYHVAGQRGFYGNQYVSTVRLVHVGKVITKATGSVGKVLDGISIYDGYKQDRNQIGYNTVRAVADVAGGWAGAVAGLKIGTSIGSLFGGVGAIPGAVIGSTVFGIIGAYGGGKLATCSVDNIYGR